MPLTRPNPLLARNRVGIVVVSHQQAYLEECLESVLNQSVAPWAIVLVDNASPSDARASDIAETMGVHAVRLGMPRSLATARNVGCEVLDECSYLLCLDGDDLLEPRFVEVYLNAALRQQADVVYGPAEMFGTMSGVVFAPAADGRQPDLRRGNYIAATSLFSRDIWRTAGGFDPELAFYEDWDFWLSCAENGARIVSVDDLVISARDSTMLIAQFSGQTIQEKRNPVYPLVVEPLNFYSVAARRSSSFTWAGHPHD